MLENEGGNATLGFSVCVCVRAHERERGRERKYEVVQMCSERYCP